MSKGYLAASFDLLNVGDLDIIAQARQRCDHLIVGVYTDEYVEGLLGRRPVTPFVERMELVRHVRGVDTVVVHDEHTHDQILPGRTIFQIGPRTVHAPERGVSWIEPSRETFSREVLGALRPSAGSETTEQTGVA